MLKENDIIKLKEGTRVMYNYFPECFKPDASKFSIDRVTEMIEVGIRYRNDTDVSVERKEAEEKIYGYLKTFKGLFPDKDIVRRFVAHQVKQPEPQQVYIAVGEYLVTRVYQKDGYLQIQCSTLQVDGNHPDVSFYFFQMLVGHPANHDLIEADRKAFR